LAWLTKKNKKIVTKERAGEKDFLDHCPAEKECPFFRQGMLRKMYGKEEMMGKESNKG
jgi:hypothetical protein